MLAALTGCKGCSDDEKAEPVARASKVAPVDSEHVALLDRRAKLRIDSAKPMVKDAAGVTQCGSDLDCFVLTAERCEPAVLDHTQLLNLLGIEQTLSAHYAIVGPGEAGCEVHREIKSLELELVPELIVALKGQGRSDEELAKIRDDALAKMKGRNPAHVACRFSGDEMLEIALDLVDKKLESKPWHKSCTAKAVEATEAAAPAPAKGAEAPR